MKNSRRVTALGASMAAAMVLGPYLVVASAALPSIPATVEVAVSYADTEGRGTSAGTCDNCVPSPWCGSSGVQFIGSSTNYNGNPFDIGNCTGGDWDGGAILVTNVGLISITLTNLTVVLPLPASGNLGSPSCAAPQRPITFNLWFGQHFYYGNLSSPAYLGGPVTLPPGGQAIFTGTSSDGSYTCPTGNYPSGPKGGTYDFDTSDANFLGGCVPTTDEASDPQITLSATGYASTTYIDKGHVLDTGGIDVGNCTPTTVDPQWGHEWLGWRAASSSCGEYCPTNQLGGPGATVTVVGPGSVTTVTESAAARGASIMTAYGLTAVVVILVVAIGLLTMAKRRPKS